jgi:hypothetical protein
MLKRMIFIPPGTEFSRGNSMALARRGARASVATMSAAAYARRLARRRFAVTISPPWRE